MNLPLAPLIAGAAAILVALVFALMPGDMLGNLVLDSGIVSLVPAAEPPLGFTARAALILIGGGGVGIIAWFSLYLLIGGRSLAISGKGADTVEDKDKVPTVRRADAHPDAPPRRPLFANQDLGEPVPGSRPPVLQDEGFADTMPVALPPLERELPADLDMPLAAYDPFAVPPASTEWFPPPARLTPTPRPPVFDPAERFETFELTPMVRAAAPPPKPEPRFMPAPVQPEPVAEIRFAPPPVIESTPVAEIIPEIVPARPMPAEPAPRPDYDPSASIHSLLDRLEKSVTARAPAPAALAPEPSKQESLQDALVTLRRLAMKA